MLGEPLLDDLIQVNCQVAAYYRRNKPDSYVEKPCFNDDAGLKQRNIIWKKINPTESGLVENNQDKITLWICIAPIWVLPEYFNWLIKKGAARLVMVSSTSRFTKIDSEDQSEVDLARKLKDAEELIVQWANQHGVKWTILRPTMIYNLGHDKNITKIAEFIIRFGFFPVVGQASGLRQPVCVKDVSSACVKSLFSDQAVNKAYNISGADKLTYRNMVLEIGKAIDKKPKIISIPEIIIYPFIKVASLFKPFKSVSLSVIKRMNKDMVFDYHEARCDFDYSPKGFLDDSNRKVF